MAQKRRRLSDEDEEQLVDEGGDERPEKLFVDEHGFPIAFFLHTSITKAFFKKKLIQAIEVGPIILNNYAELKWCQENGGTVLDTDDGVDTVLVDKTAVDVELLQLAYDINDDPAKRKIYVEHMKFVPHCVQNKRFRHRPPTRTGMGGPRGYTRR